MITASNNISATTNPYLEAKNNLKKTVSNEVISTAKSNEKENQQERTLALIYNKDHLTDILNYIKEKEFTVIKSKTIQLSENQAREFYADYATQNNYEKVVGWLSDGSNVCALILEKENAIQDWKSLMGPAAYKKARKSNPTSIRALFGKDASQNATHGSDSEASSKKEIEFIFGDSVKDAANIPHDDMDSTHDIMKTGTISLEGLVNIDLNSSSIADTNQPVIAIPAEESDVTEEKNVLSVDPISDEKSLTVAEMLPVTPVSNIDETPVVTADSKQEEVQTSTSTTSTEKIPPAVIIEDDLKTENLPVVPDTEMKMKETIPVSADKHSTNDESVTDKDLKVEEKVIVDSDLKKHVPVIAEKELKEKEIVPATNDINKEKQIIIEEAIPANNDLEKEQQIVATTETLKIDEPTDTILKHKEETTAMIEEPKEIVSPKVEEIGNAPKEAEDTNVIVNNNPRDCITMTPTPSTKDDKLVVLTHTGKENTSIEEKAEEIKAITNDEVELNNSDTNETDITPMTPPAEPIDISTTSSSATVVTETPDKKSSTTTVRSISAEKKAPLTRKPSVKAEVKTEKIVPSSSRIRPPSIKRGQNGNMVHSGEPIGRGRVTTNKINSANSSAGTTRIARLSPSATVKSEPPVVEKKKVTREVPKKPVTKVSRNLPRVATITTQKPSVVKEEEVEKKPKKRSSTQSFITRLTAPTVASQNKKADSEPGTPIQRRGTLPTKRNVGSSNA